MYTPLPTLLYFTMSMLVWLPYGFRRKESIYVSVANLIFNSVPLYYTPFSPLALGFRYTALSNASKKPYGRPLL